MPEPPASQAPLPEPQGYQSAAPYPYQGNPASFGGQEDSTQLLPPQQGLPESGWSTPPQPPAPAAGPPGDYGSDATQYLPPQTGADLDATQYIPPYASEPNVGGSPAGGQQHASGTYGGGTYGGESYGGESYGGGTYGGASHAASKADAPQSPAPQEPRGEAFDSHQEASGDRQPPAEFENLFRPSGDEPQRVDSTQPLPLFEQAAAAQSTPRGQSAPGGYGRTDTLGAPEPERRSRRAGSGSSSGGGGGASRQRKPMLLGAAGAAVLIAAGLLGGAALGGGDDSDKDDKGAPTAPADESEDAEPSAEPSEEKDPIEEQAKELDKLLADSNNSRDAVIRSVESIKKCEELPKAAQDLKAAANQRNGLVTRLNKLTVDQLPNHAKLKQELTKAWKASATADNHYAAWANQIEKPRNCKDGEARSTPQLSRAHRASGEATKAKQEAAKLWNPTARKYSLTERQPTQL